MQSIFNTHQLEPAMAEILSRHQFSRQWYQNKWATIVVVAIVINILGFVSISLFSVKPPLPLSLVSILIVILAVFSDVISTDRLVRLADEYENRGLEPRFHETNPLLPDQPSLSQQVLHITTLLKLAILIVVFFIPLAGWGFAAGSFLAAMNNNQYRKQALYELQLHDMMPGREGWEKKRDASLRHLSPSRPVLVRDS